MIMPQTMACGLLATRSSLELKISLTFGAVVSELMWDQEQSGTKFLAE